MVGDTPIHCAARYDSSESLQILLYCYALVNRKKDSVRLFEMIITKWLIILS